FAPETRYAVSSGYEGCPSALAVRAESSAETVPRFFRSLDGGATWVGASDFPNPGGGVHIVVDPADSRHLFGASLGVCSLGSGNAFESRDGGNSWSRIDRGFPSVHFYELALSP